MPVKWDDAAFQAKIRQAAMRGVTAAVEDIRTEAVRLIEETPKTGRLYYREGISQTSKSGKSFSGGHRASAPGEPPASDSGRLVGSITVEMMPERLAGQVGPRVDYGKYLEFGTQRMEPRPFMRPALANKLDAIEERIKDEILAVLK